MYGYEWTDEYGIFRLTIDAKIQKEIRPVFHEELDFFGMDQFWDYPKDTDAPLLWAEGVRRYILNGTCVAEAIGGGFYSKPTVKRLTEKRLQLQPINIDRLYKTNRSLLINLEQKAIQFIQDSHAHYSKQGFAFICAFSGGKDSLVLLNLVAKALAPSEFYVVFSNTGMELSSTLDAVEKAKQHWPQLRFEEAKCHMTPTESWDEFGPPGRRMRWCCAVHKSIPTILKLREITENYNAKAVVFDGVRAEESTRRSKYNEVSEGAKNISQVNISPIHKWGTAELYCHLLSAHILLNDAYRLGLFRVGCMVCPLSSDWWNGIANHYYGNEMKPLLNRVERYAKSTKHASEVQKYIESGGWTARMGGRGLSNGGNRIAEQIKDNTIVFTISQPTQEWLSCAPVLGAITEYVERTGVGTQKIDGINCIFRIRKSPDTLIVSYGPFSKMDRFIISHLRGVAYKVGYCKGCKDCALLEILNITIFSGVDIMSTWSARSISYRQFVALWFQLHPDDSYLKHCFAVSKTIDEIPFLVGHEIFKLRTTKPDWTAEYKQLASVMKLTPDESFFREIDAIPEYETRLDFIANLTQETRIYLLHMVGQWLRKDPTQAIASKKLGEVYPELSAYLSQNTDLLTDDIGNYMARYKAYKLENTLPDDEELYFSGVQTGSYDYRYSVLSDFIDSDIDTEEFYGGNTV